MAGHHENGFTKRSSEAFGRKVEALHALNRENQRLLQKLKLPGETDDQAIQRIQKQAADLRKQEGKSS